MFEDMEKVRTTILALIEIAYSNFPESTDIQLVVEGTNIAELTVSSYHLQKLIERPPSPAAPPAGSA